MNNRPVSTGTKTVGAALFVSMFSSMAHADNEGVIASCARIASVGDRILCLETALRRSSPEVVSPPPEARVSPPPENVAPKIVETTPEVNETAPLVDPDYGLKEKRPVEEATTMRVTVTSVRKSLRNKLIFETEEGHVWQQTDQRSVRYDDAPFAAEIRPGSLGSFFLKPDSSNLSVRVRRDK